MNEGLYRIAFSDSPPSTGDLPAPATRVLPFAASPVYTRKVVDFLEITHGDDVKVTYDISLDRTDIVDECIPGEVIAILPENNETEVDLILDLLNLDDNYYTLTCLHGKKSIPAYLPASGSVKSLFLHYLDIRSCPKKKFLTFLADYCSDPEDAERLRQLVQPQQTDAYSSFVANEGGTLLSILTHFNTCKPPLARLLEHLPALKPRYYSISSREPQVFHVTFSVIETHCRRGVCTGYLQDLLEQQSQRKLRFYFRAKSNFLRFDAVVSEPLILIGAGTGIAPFVGFLEELPTQRRVIVAFFGCRYSDRDFIYRARFEESVSDGILSRMNNAFSREQRNTAGGKMYVQDRLREEGEYLTDALMHRGAYVRICGDVQNLARMIADAFKELLVEHGRIDTSEADEILDELKKSKRYVVDAWL